MDGTLPDRLLEVDVTAGTAESVPLPDGWPAAYLGGKGIGARYLYEAVGPDVDPLAPENVLLVLVGPLTGYLPGGGRCTVVTKSPLTGIFLDSYVGGSLGASLRARLADHAGLAITGAGEAMRVLDLRDDEPRLDPAGDLRGATNDEVNAAYPDALVASIGPAGEHAVRFATIATNGGDHHAGRGGAGAVLGSKGLKAIVLPETTALEPPTAALRDRRDAALATFEESPHGRAYAATGTLETVEIADAAGMLPTEGWRASRFAGSEDIGLAAVREAAVGREREDGGPAGDYRVQPAEDYETVIRGGTPIALGSGLGIDDFDAVSALGGTCDRLGIDVISAGNVAAVAIAAAERGHVDRELSFGDPESVQALLEEVAARSTSLGDTLAQGVGHAAAALEVADVIPSVKAMAAPSFDPRGAPAMALAFATSDRGACHRRAVPATVDAFSPDWTATQLARTLITEQDRRAALWSLVVDDRTSPLFGDLGASWLAALDHKVRPADVQRVGERIWTLTRLFNVREGVDRDDDTLPAAFTRPTSDGTAGIDQTAFERALDRYYEIREWDRQGRPSRRLLERLDLDDVVDDKTPVGGHPLRSR